MIFGFGRKHVEEEEEEEELVLFQGALNGKNADLAANAKLAEAALVPAKQIVSEALARRAGIIRLEPKGERAVVYNIVDGVAYAGMKLPSRVGAAVVQIMKLLGGMDPKERKKAQKGGIKAEFADFPYELRLETTPVAGGAEKLLVRAQNMKQLLDTAEDIGIGEELKEKLRDLTGEHKGAFLVCGSPLSGTSTTLFGVMRSLDGYTHSIFNMADLGGQYIKNVSDFDNSNDADLGVSLQRLIRQEGEIVLVDPISSSDDVKQIFTFAENIAIIAETQGKDAAEGIFRILKAATSVDMRDACLEWLRAVLSQKLIRLLCPKCRVAYRPNPKLLAKVGLPKDTKALYRHPKKEESHADMEGPCENCDGIGYRGQTALIEMIEMTDAVRKLLEKDASIAELKAVVRKEGMPSVQQMGLKLVAEGRTSLEELQRAMKTA